MNISGQKETFQPWVTTASPFPGLIYPPPFPPNSRYPRVQLHGDSSYATCFASAPPSPRLRLEACVPGHGPKLPAPPPATGQAMPDQDRPHGRGGSLGPPSVCSSPPIPLPDPESQSRFPAPGPRAGVSRAPCLPAPIPAWGVGRLRRGHVSEPLCCCRPPGGASRPGTGLVWAPERKAFVDFTS